MQMEILVMLNNALTLVLVAIALIVLFLIRKKVSKLMYLAVILLVIATLTNHVNIVIAVGIIFLVDLYTESKKYLLDILKRLAEPVPLATNGGEKKNANRTTKTTK
ncbi:MAG: hypothetical protein J7L47_08805 [Candidatus Odinarchaeota archaeon]|nr:hypothetical protein [Candidatus Odinarchaeota archaeon]